MTAQLIKALHRVEDLSPEEQDAIAAEIIESLDAEHEWTRRFQATPVLLGTLAEEALDEHRSGETLPFD